MNNESNRCDYHLKLATRKTVNSVVIALSKQVSSAHQQMLSWLDGKRIDKPKMGTGQEIPLLNLIIFYIQEYQI